MSIFSALDTAVSGLTAQSVAFSNISNNISNSSTVGYKATDTSFSDYVEASGALEGQSGNVQAKTQYHNQAAGPITASVANGAVAVNGNGFFAVSEVSGSSATNAPQFSNTQYYTRAGDFSSDKTGYLVNSAGEYLDGYMVDSTGKLNTSSLTQINVNNVKYTPTPTANVTLSSTLPAAATVGQTETSTETVYDANGTAQTLTFNWSETTAAAAANATAGTAATGSTWALTVGGTNATTDTATVSFNPDGSLASVTDSTGAVLPAGTLTIAGVGADKSTSSIALNLGTLGATSGTNATGAAFNAGNTTQDGTAAGNYTGFTMQTDGSIMGNFDNGQSQLIGKIPLATFSDANALQAQDGQAYTATTASGIVSMQLVGQNGAGSLETRSVEGSNTSLDNDLTKLIVAQEAYSANAKVVTTANDMLQAALAMKQ